jgi:hypothetical protein
MTPRWRRLELSTLLPILAAGFPHALPLAANAQTPTHSPGHETQDARSASKTVTHGASEFSPGDKMNDKRGK